ncbi:amidohydrolase family protein [Arthrobacter sp. H14-L1]|uniref:amidohydrolase family protein n=1 Tax=Arthrobacter sp. H14-L1 TaxID=2996697 RepID=UPI00226EC077|nr:amidohydrolase family protein [Arthrobacter sp. H14-L1]MCY0903345.1 amidohydrolase family protein [Arthrobacter sp. H14-L1]
MSDPTVIRNVRPWGQSAADVTISDDRVGSVVAHDPSSSPSGVIVIEGRGRLLLPSFSDVHVHLDSNRLALPFRGHTGAPGVWGMMLNDRGNWRDAETSIGERAQTALRMMIERGTTRVRSFAQVDTDCGMEKFEAVLAARQMYQDRAEVKIIAFPQAGLLLENGTAELMEEALKAGADVMGGIDPCALDKDPVRHLDIVFGLAEKYQVPIDIHLHEPGELGHFSAALIAERTRALGMQGNVTISHGYPLWGVSEAHTRTLIQTWAELDISTATVAPGGPFQLPLADLTDAGVRVGLGQDGQRDYWSPYGNADMLDRTWQLAFVNGYRSDHLIEHALAVATAGGASILDRSVPRLASVTDRPGTNVGDPADFLLVSGECVSAAVMDRPSDRTVIHRGRVVADQLAIV